MRPQCIFPSTRREKPSPENDVGREIEKLGAKFLGIIGVVMPTLIPCILAILVEFGPEMAIPRHVEMQIAEYAFDLPKGILGAVAHVESRGNPKAMSRTGDYGLLQVNCATWRRSLRLRSCRELLDPHRSIWSGAWILSRCYRRWGHLPDHAWIGAYNAGSPGSVRADAYRDRVIEAWTTRTGRTNNHQPRT